MPYYPWEAQTGRCAVCDRWLSGRQEMYCGEAHRKAHKRFEQLTAAERSARLFGRNCAYCEEAFDPRNPRQRFCSTFCAERSREAEFEAREDVVCQLEGCENNAGWEGTGRARHYCSAAHKQKAYRLRKAGHPTR
ncbi:hypothetical protein SSP35_15_00730 [Streptomyces sp. NBRC 110611]|nr:hypothetical protein SSP35_15_00730 [Streptomyces sp. NBRC 110611]